MAADIGCLTKEQARAKWPGQWLYWHTQNHCWDNQKGRVTHRRVITQDEIDTMQYRMEAEKRLATCCWPPPSPFMPWELRVTGAFQ